MTAKVQADLPALHSMSRSLPSGSIVFIHRCAYLLAMRFSNFGVQTQAAFHFSSQSLSLNEPAFFRPMDLEVIT